jgi:hypothetical protein
MAMKGYNKHAWCRAQMLSHVAPLGASARNNSFAEISTKQQ